MLDPTVVAAGGGGGGVSQILRRDTSGINIARKVEGMKSIRALTVRDGCESEIICVTFSPRFVDMYLTNIDSLKASCIGWCLY